jgi:acyl-CoA synthetase (AMP-forming)/AMP-acid ligase II
VADCATLAGRWRAAGLRPGDIVVIGLPNGTGLLSQFFGVLAAEGVPVLVAPDTPAARWAELAKELGARAAVALRLPPSLDGLERLESAAGWCMAFFSPRPEPSAQSGEVVLMTSGTSGAASGCVFPFEALLLNAERHAASIGQTAADTVLVNLPLSFSFTLVAQALATCLCGGRLVISGPPFHAASYLRCLEQAGCTVSSLTPMLVRALLAAGGSLPPGLRVLSVGGAALAAEQVERLLHLRDGRELYLTYGLTQAGPRVSTNLVSSSAPERFASVGPPLRGVRVELEPTPDSKGLRQLIVASETVMRRRIGRIDSRPPDELRAPGVVATGDVFEQDPGGYLFFRARLSDFLTRGDDKICLETVRRLAAGLPDVRRARADVFRKPDGGSDYRLVLETAPGCELRETDFRRLLARLLRRSEFPALIEVLRAGAEPGGYK